MSEDDIVDLVAAMLPGPVLEVYELGDDMRVLVVEGEDKPYFEHLCRMPLITKRVAPRCTNHTWDPATVTLRASILCPDCGLHGWVTDGVWSGA